MTGVKTLEKLTNIIESLLFVSGKEISLNDICEKLNVSINEARLAALELQKKYSGESGLLFLYFNDKIQFGSNPVYGEQVEAVLNPIRERELSRSMLETAAIIAYKQPITRGEIEELRGNSDYAIANLQKLGIIEIIGKKDAVGRPSLFATTDKFLKRFQISSLEDLPSYDDIMAQVKVLNDESEDTYLYKKDVYVDNGEEDVMPPQREFVPKQKAEEEESDDDKPQETEIKDEEIPDYLKGDDVEVISADEEYEEDEEDTEDSGEETDDEDSSDEDEEFAQYSIDDMEYEDEEEESEEDEEYEEDEEEEGDYEEDDV